MSAEVERIMELVKQFGGYRFLEKHEFATMDKFHQRESKDANARRASECLDAIRIALLAVVPGWRSMESCPRDNSTVLVWLPIKHLGSHVQVATFHPNVSCVGGIFAFDLEAPPIAWQPIPTPPAPGGDTP